MKHFVIEGCALIKGNMVNGWLICIAAGLTFFFAFFQLNLMNVMGAEVLQEFQLSSLALSFISATYFISLMLFFVPTGIALDLISPKKLLLTAIILNIFSLLLFAHADHLYSIVFYRFIAGFFHSVAFLSCLRLSSQWLKNDISLAIGLIMSIGLLGGVAAQTPLVFLVEYLGWRRSIYVLIIMGIVISIMSLLFVKDHPKNSPSISFVNIGQIRKNFCCSITDKHLWLCASYASFINAPTIILGALWSSLYLSNVYGINTYDASIITTMLFAGTILGSPLIGWFSDFFQQREKIMFYGAVVVFLAVASLSLFPTFSIFGMALIFFIIGFFTGVQTLSYVNISAAGPDISESTRLAIASTTVMGSAALFQLFFGFLVYKTATFNYENEILNFELPYLFILGCLFVLMVISTKLRIDGRYSKDNSIHNT